MQLYAESSWSPGQLLKVQKKTPDYSAMLSYVGATAVQYTLVLAALHVVQIVLLKRLPAVTLPLPSLPLPFSDFSLRTPSILFRGLKLAVPAALGLPALTLALPAATFPALSFPSLNAVGSALNLSSSKNMAVFFLSLFVALRTRIFSPLDNSRPKASSADPVFKNRLRPWFQPPPLAFPVIWTNIAILRAISSTIVYAVTGTLLCPAIFALVLHLCIGDTWNTINNVERRMGTAALVVPAVLVSAAYALYRYSLVSTTAAYMLSPMVAWLTVANCLVFSIWRLNYKLAKSPSLFPSVEEGPRSPWRMPLSSSK